MQTKINWILILQGWAMLWVVIGHAPINGNIANGEFYKILYDFAYSFHMPLFVFISGYLFYITRIQKQKKYLPTLTDKLKRLGIPYLTFSIFTLIIKSLILKEDAARPSSLSLHDLFYGLLYPGDGALSLLWFISAILWLFSLMPVWKLTLKSKYYTYIVFVLLIIGNIYAPSNLKIFSLYEAIKYSIFFFIGLVIAKYDIIDTILVKRKNIAFYISVTLYLFSLFIHIPLLTNIFGISLSIALSLIIDKFLPQCFNSFRDYTYQIYLMGIFFQILIKVLFKHEIISSYIVMFTLNIILGLYMPVIISKSIKSLNIRPLSLCFGLSK